MSQATICDGCGELAGESIRRGRIRALDYCECCAAVVDEYHRQMEALRREQAEQFAKRMAEIRAEAEGKCPKLRLPI